MSVIWMHNARAFPSPNEKWVQGYHQVLCKASELSSFEYVPVCLPHLNDLNNEDSTRLLAATRFNAADAVSHSYTCRKSLQTQMQGLNC